MPIIWLKKTDNVTIYALVINGGKIGSEEKLQEVYRRIMERDEVKQSEAGSSGPDLRC